MQRAANTWRCHILSLLKQVWFEVILNIRPNQAFKILSIYKPFPSFSILFEYLVCTMYSIWMYLEDFTLALIARIYNAFWVLSWNSRPAYTVWSWTTSSIRNLTIVNPKTHILPRPVKDVKVHMLKKLKVTFGTRSAQHPPVATGSSRSKTVAREDFGSPEPTPFVQLHASIKRKGLLFQETGRQTTERKR